MIKSRKAATAEANATNITVGLGTWVDCVVVGTAISVNGRFVAASVSPPDGLKGDVAGSSIVRSSEEIPCDDVTVAKLRRVLEGMK